MHKNCSIPIFKPSPGKDPAFGLLHYDYGFRIYHPGLGRFLSVDPLAADYAAWSPYNYVMGNPIRLIDPDGRAPDNTIVFDDEGNELYRAEDSLKDAIVVVRQEWAKGFNLTKQHLEKLNLSSDEVSKTLRLYGDNYMVEGMVELMNITEHTYIPKNDHNYWDKNGNKASNINPEYSAPLVFRDRGNLTSVVTVDLEKKNTRMITDMSSIGGGPYIHTHPSFPEGTRAGETLNVSEGVEDGPPGPSGNLDIPGLIAVHF